MCLGILGGAYFLCSSLETWKGDLTVIPSVICILGWAMDFLWILEFLD